MPPIVDWEGVIADASKELLVVSLEQIKEAEAFLVKHHLSEQSYSDHLATAPDALAWYVECVNTFVRFYSTLGRNWPKLLQVRTAVLLTEQVGQGLALSPAMALIIMEHANEDGGLTESQCTEKV